MDGLQLLAPIVVAVLSLLAAAQTGQAQPDDFTVVVTGSRLVVPGSEHTAAYDGHDAISLIGGIGLRGYGDQMWVDRIYKYTLSTGAVEFIGRYKAVSGGAAFMDNDDIIHIGGYNETHRFSDIDRISTVNGSWTNVNHLPEPTSGVSAVWDRERGVAYLFGGTGNGGFITSVLMYNTSNGFVTQVAQLPEGRMNTVTAWDPQRRMAYIFGDLYTPTARDVLTFDPASDQVTKLTTKLTYPMLYPRAVFVEFIGKALILDRDGCLLFDPHTHIVTSLGYYCWVTRDQPASIYVPKFARIYIFGGRGRYHGESSFLDEISYISFAPDEISTTEYVDFPRDFPMFYLTIVTGSAALATLIIATYWCLWRRGSRAIKKKNNTSARLQAILHQFRTGSWPNPTDVVAPGAAQAQQPYICSEAGSDGTLNSGAGLTTPYNLSRYEIAKQCLRVDESILLGSGQYGVVFKGTLRLGSQSQSHEQVVAVKKLKPDAAVEVGSVTAFLKEVKLMIHVGVHDNVVGLLGASTVDVGSLCLVLEYCEHGSLKKYLAVHREVFGRALDDVPISSPSTYSYVRCSSYSGSVPLAPPKLTPLDADDLLRWTLEMAAGMEHLAERKVVHGDLALRNVLLDGCRTVKISDFGLGSRLYEYVNYVQKTDQKRLPWRWMAPETLMELRFSHASDVWSFGVAAWEIFSLARVPYPGSEWDPSFVQQLLRGYRNSRPEHASGELYALMASCWAKEAGDRPSMAQVRQQVADMRKESTN